MSETEGQEAAQIEARPDNEPVSARQFYIGCKQVQAEPMSLGAYNEYRGWTIPANEDPYRQGYLAVYPDGYESWSPKDVFESAYLPMGVDNDGTRVTVDMVENFIDHNGSASIHHGKVFVGSFMLVNGFAVTESSACVDPANFNQELGAQITGERVRSKVFELLGFLLQSARFGFRHTPGEFTEG